MKLKTIFKILAPTLGVIGLSFDWLTFDVTILGLITIFSLFGCFLFAISWIVDNWDNEVI